MSYSDDEFDGASDNDDKGGSPPQEDVVQRALRLGEWALAKDPTTGKSYYFNTKTRETTWDLQSLLRAQILTKSPAGTAAAVKGPGIESVAKRKDETPAQPETHSDTASTAFSEPPVAALTNPKPSAVMAKPQSEKVDVGPKPNSTEYESEDFTADQDDDDKAEALKPAKQMIVSGVKVQDIVKLPTSAAAAEGGLTKDAQETQKKAVVDTLPFQKQAKEEIVPTVNIIHPKSTTNWSQVQSLAETEINITGHDGESYVSRRFSYPPAFAGHGEQTHNAGDATADGVSPIFSFSKDITQDRTLLLAEGTLMPGGQPESTPRDNNDSSAVPPKKGTPLESPGFNSSMIEDGIARLRLEEVFAAAAKVRQSSRQVPKLTYTPLPKNTARLVVPRMLPSRPMLRACAEDVARSQNKLEDEIMNVMLRLMMKDATNATPRVPIRMDASSRHPGISPTLSSGDDLRQLFLVNLTRFYHSLSDPGLNHAARLLLTDLLTCLQEILQFQEGDEVMTALYYVNFTGPLEFHTLAERTVHCLPFEIVNRSDRKEPQTAAAAAYRLEHWVCTSHIVAACRAATEALRELEISASYDDVAGLMIGHDPQVTKKRQQRNSATITTLPTQQCFTLQRHQTSEQRLSQQERKKERATPRKSYSHHMEATLDCLRSACRMQAPKADAETLEQVLDETVREVLTDAEIHKMIVKQATVRVAAIMATTQVQAKK